MLSRRRFLGLLGLAPLAKWEPAAAPAEPELGQLPTGTPEAVGSINHAFHDFVSFDNGGLTIATDIGRMGEGIGRWERSASSDGPYCETCAGYARQPTHLTA